MSGLLHELVQRLAQKLLRQVRLEAAQDATPAITLEIDEDARTQAETGLAAAIADEQAAPEELPRIIHPFLRRPAQPTPPAAINGRAGKPVDQRRGPATTSGRPSRETAQLCRRVAGGTRRTAPFRAEFIRVRARVQAASEALDGFLLEYLQEGPELAGEYPQRVADERSA